VKGAFAAGLCFLLMGEPAAIAADSKAAKTELRDLQTRIEALQKQLAASEESHGEAADALRESERAISEANRNLRDLAAQGAGLSHQLNDLRARSKEFESSLTIQQTLLARLFYREYLKGEPDALRLLLNQQDANQAARDIYYYGHISRERARLISGLRDGLGRVRENAVETEQQAAALAKVSAEQAGEKKRLEQVKMARSRVLTRISRDINKQRRQMTTLKRDESRLSRLVEQLGRIIARAPAPRTAVKPRIRNDRVPEISADESMFSRLKGKLALPVRGELGNRYGSPRSDGGVLWRGLFITAPSGEQVRAVAGGRVVFADWLRGFGNLLIVDHGEGYMSLYGYNETLYRRVIAAGVKIRVYTLSFATRASRSIHRGG
jgi:murein hydrolase activator